MTETGVLTARGFRPLAGPFARWAERRGTTAAATGRAGLVLTAVAAVWFSSGTPRDSLIGSGFLALVLFADAAGDRLWSESGPRDALTAWSTTVLTHLRECVLYVGLAAGAVAAGAADAWVWAAGALIARALHGSALSARAARAAGAGAAPRDSAASEAGRLSPIDVVDPSRSGRAPADPSFTAELLGDAEPEPVDNGRRDAPIRIRTTPPPRGGGLTPLRSVSAGAGSSRKDRNTTGRVPIRIRTPKAGHGLMRALTAFASSERFLVVAVTVTIWDASVTFIALVVGSVIALAVGAATDSLRHAP
ncbi:hypothetical protein [Actinorugispora endophytica]|uniref:hypothetical protein n=1 Tax=Actinorugispora endophytica TaxID=1605990 RepID=UPI0010603FD3|nr:hypothetical protein [Actinorugispora endophytica]